MKEIFFMMSLVLPSGQLPTHQEKMESLEACHAKVIETTAHMAADDPNLNGNFRFAAGCMVVSTKADPA